MSSFLDCPLYGRWAVRGWGPLYGCGAGVRRGLPPDMECRATGTDNGTNRHAPGNGPDAEAGATAAGSAPEDGADLAGSVAEGSPRHG